MENSESADAQRKQAQDNREPDRRTEYERGNGPPTPVENLAEASRGFRVAVNAIIERNGQVLLARRRDIGWWNLPGGGVELDETVDEGLRREVREEIGCEVEIVRLVGVYSKPQKHEVVLSFLCHLPADQEQLLQTTEEISEVGWFLPPEFPRDLLPKHRQRVEDAFLGQAEAILRAQRSSTEEDQGLSTAR